MLALGVSETTVGIAILRQFTLKETRMGQERMALVEGLHPFTIIQEYGRTIRTAIQNRVVRTFLIVRNLEVSSFNKKSANLFQGASLKDN